MELSNKTSPERQGLIWKGHPKRQSISHVTSFTNPYFEEEMDEGGMGCRGLQVRDLPLQYPASDCSKMLPKAAPVVQTVSGWEEALPNSSPNATTRNSTTEEKQCLNPACKLTRGKATAACCRASCNTGEPHPSPPHRPKFTAPCQCSLVHSCDATGT